MPPLLWNLAVVFSECLQQTDHADALGTANRGNCHLGKRGHPTSRTPRPSDRRDRQLSHRVEADLSGPRRCAVPHLFSLRKPRFPTLSAPSILESRIARCTSSDQSSGFRMHAPDLDSLTGRCLADLALPSRLLARTGQGSSRSSSS